MINEKNILKSRRIITSLIREDGISKPKKGLKEFFLKKSVSSFTVSKKLMDLSEELDVFMWVITTAYYSMFFAATALLAHFGHQLKAEQGKHILTYHALVYYFIDQNDKLEKHFVEEYKSAKEEAEEIIQITEPIEELHAWISAFKYESNKRKEFTYDLGKVAEKSKAITSIERATSFLKVVKEVIG